MATYDFSAAFASSFSQAGGTGEEKTLLALFKEFLGIPPEDTTNDEALSQALNMAGDAVETYLDRAVVKRTLEEYFPQHFGTVVLHDLPYDTAVPVAVTLDGETQDDYSVFLSRGKLAHLTRTGCRHDQPMDWRPYQQVIVTYTAGFDPIPSDLANAIIYTANEFYSSVGTGAVPGGASGDIKSMSIYDVGSMSFDVGGSSDGSVSATGVIPSTAAEMLLRYRRMVA